MKNIAVPILGLFLAFNSFHSMANSLSYEELYHKSKQMIDTNATITSEVNRLKVQNNQLQLDNAYMSRKILKIEGELAEQKKTYQALYSEHASSKDKFSAAEQLVKLLSTNINQFLKKTAPKESLGFDRHNKGIESSGDIKGKDLGEVDYLSLLSKELKSTNTKSFTLSPIKKPQIRHQPVYVTFSKS